MGQPKNRVNSGNIPSGQSLGKSKANTFGHRNAQGVKLETEYNRPTNTRGEKSSRCALSLRETVRNKDKKPCGNTTATQLTFSKLQQAVALGVSRGLDEDVLALVAPVTFADLVNEQAGARRYDSSYSAKKNENGSEALTYWGPSGKIEVVPHMFVHQGESLVFPPKEIIKVGPLDHISPTLPGIDGDIFFQSPTAASYEVRLFSDFAVLNNMPAKSTWVKNITNSQSA